MSDYHNTWSQKTKLDGRCTRCAKPRGDSPYASYCVPCRNTRVQQQYKMTDEEFANLPDACEICGSKDNLVIDHNHSTGRYRGRLCRLCNQMLGLAKDNPNTLLAGYQYLLDRNLLT